MYNYKQQKNRILTEDGQRLFLQIRDNTQKLLNQSGAVMLANAISVTMSNDSWVALACIDRLVELGEIVEITKKGAIAQHRVFISSKL